MVFPAASRCCGQESPRAGKGPISRPDPVARIWRQPNAPVRRHSCPMPRDTAWMRPGLGLKGRDRTSPGQSAAALWARSPQKFASPERVKPNRIGGPVNPVLVPFWACPLSRGSDPGRCPGSKWRQASCLTVRARFQPPGKWRATYRAALHKPDDPFPGISPPSGLRDFVDVPGCPRDFTETFHRLKLRDSNPPTAPLGSEFRLQPAKPPTYPSAREIALQRSTG